jgi:hypothetical protein
VLAASGVTAQVSDRSSPWHARQNLVAAKAAGHHRHRRHPDQGHGDPTAVLTTLNNNINALLK